MIIEFEEMILAKIDARIDNASEDELFAGGYLRGHVSLAAADCEEEGIQDVTVLKQRIEESINLARSELSPADRQLVLSLWQTLSTEAVQ
ncbi:MULTISPECIES: YfcL family protein [unclassified Vibrio]|uniref:YfcL family protein n=1 Tax=Vibrio sp. HB236076 TaxID=3232307 RepID=A0AB39HEW5_9VIBR|nr:YfcL family protein [Vibrio sp. HB161653]MDP5254752.1 YfcL family protein [Vibrio sp. HB161653]